MSAPLNRPGSVHLGEIPLHEGEGHHPLLTKTETGCHVWEGTSYPPCHKHGTPNCCLIAHATEAARRAFNQPRCEFCGQFVKDWGHIDCLRDYERRVVSL